MQSKVDRKDSYTLGTTQTDAIIAELYIAREWPSRCKINLTWNTLVKRPYLKPETSRIRNRSDIHFIGGCRGNMFRGHSASSERDTRKPRNMNAYWYTRTAASHWSSVTNMIKELWWISVLFTEQLTNTILPRNLRKLHYLEAFLSQKFTRSVPYVNLSYSKFTRARDIGHTCLWCRGPPNSNIYHTNKCTRLLTEKNTLRILCKAINFDGYFVK
jgi:hypothetical protein